MRKRLAALLCSLALILGVGVAAAPAALAGNPFPPCSYGDYFNAAGQQYRATPVQTVGSQRGKAWCVGFGMWVSPASWSLNQRNYEMWNTRNR